MNQILVIDDEPNIRMVVELVLSSSGYEVITAENGLDGLEKLRKGLKPDLIFVDLRMPKLSGKEFTAKVRSNSKLNNIPIVIISASIPGLGDFPPKDAYQGVLPKPFDLNDILELTESICKRNHLLSVS